MKKKLFAGLLIGALLLLQTTVCFADCISGHWLSKKSNDGSILILEDGSTWQIESVDRVITMFWLPTDSIIFCENDGVLIDIDDNGEKVYARRLR